MFQDGFDGGQLADKVTQWAMFLLAVAAIFFPSGRAVQVALALIALLLLGGILLGHRSVQVVLQTWRVVREVKTFLPENSRDVLKKVGESYWYFGVSGHTISNYFQEAIRQFPRTADVRILLAMPYSACVEMSKESELQRRPTEDQMEEVSCRIEATARFYAASSADPRVQVRFYNEYHGYWAHIIGGKHGKLEAYVGHYLRGEDGLHATVLHLIRGPHGNYLLKFYEDEFKRIWESAMPVEEYFKKTPVAQPSPVTRCAGAAEAGA